jgi:hypothetical protein
MENGGKIGSHDDLRGDGTLTSLLQIGASSVCKLLTMEAPPPVGGPTLILRRPSPCGNLGIRQKHRSVFVWF